MNEALATAMIGLEFALAGLILAFHATILGRYLDIIEKGRRVDHLLRWYKKLLLTNIAAVGTILFTAVANASGCIDATSRKMRLLEFTSHRNLDARLSVANNRVVRLIKSSNGS